MLSKEELRKARLATLGSALDAGHVDKKPHTMPGQARRCCVTEGELREAYSVMHEGGGCTREDLGRWYDQGFVFCTRDGAAPFGLVQTEGGPCGVLAPVQAEIIRELFDASASSDDVLRGDCLPYLDANQVDRLFKAAILRILRRASSSSDKISLVSYVGSGALSPSTQASELEVCTFSVDNPHEVDVIMQKTLPLYKTKQGCMLFLLSVLFTRGLETIKDDMDAMSGNTLIGQYGHCNQDLINLLLTGEATSNVIDGDVNIGCEEERLMIKGVSRRPAVGYLTHLEALRLCQVGAFYKMPEYPIWVLGSSSHFTVLFSFDPEVNRESAAEQLLAEARRAFRLVDQEDCGYIASDRLAEVLRAIKGSSSSIQELLQSEANVSQLRSKIEMDGGIVLWSSFWQSVSQLMSGSPVGAVLCSVAVAPLLLTNGPSLAGRGRSDSDVARQLQDELNSSYFNGSPAQQPLVNNFTDGLDNNEMSSARAVDSPRGRSDSDLARELQERWSREDALLPALLPAEAPSLFSGADIEAVARSVDGNDGGGSGSNAASRRFVLYHFNGFERRGNDGSSGRAPTLTRFALVLPQASPIGQPLASSPAAMCGGSPFEEALRTRWAACSVDWLGAAAPNID